MKTSLSCKLKIFGFVLTLCLALSFCITTKAKAGSDIKLNVTEVSIAKDETFRLRAYNVPNNARILYRSGNPDVAFVDARGYITGISNGECKVTATVIDRGAPVATLSCNVLIGPAAISIKFTKTELVMEAGKRKTIKYILSPLNTVERPVFYSVDKFVASVTSIGRVRAKNPGITKVFAFLKNECSAECTIYVLDEEEYIEYRESGDLTNFIEKYENADDEDSSEDGDDENSDDDDDVEEIEDSEPTSENVINK